MFYFLLWGYCFLWSLFSVLDFFFAALNTFPGAAEEAGVSVSSNFHYAFILLNFHVYFVTKASIIMSHGFSDIIVSTQGRTEFSNKEYIITLQNRNLGAS